MQHVVNGMPAAQLGAVRWVKSARSTAEGNCVEMAELADGQVAVRNSRFPQGPALVYTRGEIAALFSGVRAGEFDYLEA